MAGDSDTPPTDMDFHVQTYGSVIAMLKWGAVAVAIIAALVIWVISRA
ncbi:aa3-type cytochrome c oxidase subunit IV [uncultured Sphingomonas sp.]